MGRQVAYIMIIMYIILCDNLVPFSKTAFSKAPQILLFKSCTAIHEITVGLLWMQVHESSTSLKLNGTDLCARTDMFRLNGGILSDPMTVSGRVSSQEPLSTWD